MLEQLLSYIKNWFRVRDDVDGIHTGTYEIKGGKIVLPFILGGQYFRIKGSVLNDGLYKMMCDGSVLDGDEKVPFLKDETFTGSIWALAIPVTVISLAKDIKCYIEKYGDVLNSPYNSESFGGYSYSKSAGTGSSGGDFEASLPPELSNRILQYKRIREL